MEKSLKNEIVKAVEAVKKKVKRMRENESNNEKILETMFKPITNPLENMVVLNKNISDYGKDNNLKTASSCNSYDRLLKDTKKEEEDTLESNNDDSDTESELNDSVKTDSSFQSTKSSDELVKNSMSPKIYENVLYGVRFEKGKPMMGTAHVKYNDNVISIDDHSYELTHGLNELLFKKKPDLSMITEDDLKKYKLLLLSTNAHRRDFDPNKPIKSNKGSKYLKVIKPLFSLKTGLGNTSIHFSKESTIPMKKKFKSECDYVYWNDPNELVERLKLLMASKHAGNTGLDNEIISILEELRESEIIT